MVSAPFSDERPHLLRGVPAGELPEHVHGDLGALFEDKTAGLAKSELAIGRNPIPAQNGTGDALLTKVELGITGGGSWVPKAETSDFRPWPAVPLSPAPRSSMASRQDADAEQPEHPRLRQRTDRLQRRRDANGGNALYSEESARLYETERSAVEAYLKTRWAL